MVVFELPHGPNGTHSVVCVPLLPCLAAFSPWCAPLGWANSWDALHLPLLHLLAPLEHGLVQLEPLSRLLVACPQACYRHCLGSSMSWLHESNCITP